MNHHVFFFRSSFLFNGAFCVFLATLFFPQIPEKPWVNNNSKSKVKVHVEGLGEVHEHLAVRSSVDIHILSVAEWYCM